MQSGSEVELLINSFLL